jgi:hypothetical protein
MEISHDEPVERRPEKTGLNSVDVSLHNP